MSFLSKQKFELCILGFLSLAYCLLGFNLGINIFDEGMQVYGAVRILNGDIPFKDFFYLYPPGQIYLIAGLFKFFGNTLMTLRLWLIILSSLFSLLVYYISLLFIRKRSAIIVWFLSLIWISSYRPISPMVSLLPLVFISCLYMVYFFRKENPRYLLLAGLFAGLCLLFKQEHGVFIIIGELFLFFLFSIEESNKDLTGNILNFLKLVKWYLTGLGIILVPAAIFILSVVPIRDLEYHFMTFPLTKYAQFYSLRYPAPFPNLAYLFSHILSLQDFIWQIIQRIAYYFPMTVYLTAAFTIGFRMLKGILKNSPAVWGLRLFIILGILFHIHGFIRGNLHMLRPTFFFAFIVFCYLTDNISVSRKTALITFISILFVFAMVFIPLVEKSQFLYENLPSPFSFNLPRAKGIIWDERGETYEKLVRYIQEKTAEEERIFVGNIRHDLIFTNDVMLYYLSERQSATKYHELESAIMANRAIQEAIISDIQKYRVRYVVLWKDDFPQPRPGGLSGKSNGVFVLDNFIRKEFTPVTDYPSYTVLKRNSEGDKNEKF